VLFQSGSGATAKVGISTTTPASTLDVKGSETVRGNLSLPATGTATASKNSQPATLTASAFNSGTGTAVAAKLPLAGGARWQQHCQHRNLNVHGADYMSTKRADSGEVFLSANAAGRS
jgi:hypothetical protein